MKLHGKSFLSPVISRIRLVAPAVLTGLTSYISIGAQSTGPKPSLDAFEVATIRATGAIGLTAGRYMRMQSAHTFQVKNYTTKDLIASAYNLNLRAITGEPGWADSDRYEIVAKTPGELRPTFDDQMAMLRRLLSDRFNLAFHREKKNFSLYELTVFRDGAKLRSSQALPDEASNVTSTVFPDASGGIDHVLMPARNVTMAQFAAVLQRAILDRPVVDHTGLQGRYDFDLEWMPDETQFGGQMVHGPQDSARPGLFPALREQLGLKLEATRGPIETLVVDQVDRPSEN